MWKDIKKQELDYIEDFCNWKYNGYKKLEFTIPVE